MYWMMSLLRHYLTESQSIIWMSLILCQNSLIPSAIQKKRAQPSPVPFKSRCSCLVDAFFPQDPFKRLRLQHSKGDKLINTWEQKYFNGQFQLPNKDYFLFILHSIPKHTKYLSITIFNMPFPFSLQRQDNHYNIFE